MKNTVRLIKQPYHQPEPLWLQVLCGIFVWAFMAFIGYCLFSN